MTLLARCCKPVPPDPVIGFVTKGRGISIHRRDCSTLKRLAEASPERLITADWGKVTGNTFATDIMIEAHDRPSLLRDLSDIMAREKKSTSPASIRCRAIPWRACVLPWKSAAWTICRASLPG